MASFPTSYVPTPATFTGRTSTATFYDSAGIIQTAASGVARSNAFFPDSSGVMRPAGLLLEAAGTNLITQSNTLSSFVYTSHTLTQNVTTSPDGTTNASRVLSNGGGTAYKFTTTSNSSTFSFYCKLDSVSWVRTDVTGAGGSWFNLQTGEKGTGAGSIQKLPNGWNRISIYTTSTGSIQTQFFPTVADNSFDRTTGNAIFVWGAQLEEVSYPTSYIPTVASTVTRSADTSTSATVTRASELVSILGDSFRSFYSSNIGTFFTDGSIIGEKNNTSSSSFVSLGTTSNDVFTSFLLYDNRLNVGFIAPNLANITQFADLTGQTIKGVTSFNDSLTNNASSSSAINGTLYNANSVGNMVPSGNAATVGGYDRLGIGRTIRTSTFTNSINGRIRRLTYWPVRLPDAQLQTLTR